MRNAEVDALFWSRMPRPVTLNLGVGGLMSKLRPHIRLLPVVLCLALPALAEAHTAATPEDILLAEYAVYQSIPLNPTENGIEGSLQILQDKRVTPEYRKTWGMSANPQSALGEDAPLVQSIKARPLQDGHLRLVGVDGRKIVDEALEAPLGEVKEVFLYGTKFPTYLVSVDLGIGFGSYAGPATMLVEIRKGKLLHIQAAEHAGGERDRLWLGESGKSAWRIVPASSGKGKEIQQMQCHPNFANPNWEDTNEFVVIYSTYRFTHGKWHRASREKIGFWENEGEWPNRSEFP